MNTPINPTDAAFPGATTTFGPKDVGPLGSSCAYPNGMAHTVYHQGMPLRAWLTGQALAGLGDWGSNPQSAAQYAVKLADATIAELNKGTP